MFGVWQLSVLAIVALCTADQTEKRPKLGGWRDVDTKDKGLQKALKFVMSEYNKGSDDVYSRKIMTIAKARKQIVAGVKYDVDVVTGQTSCLKTDPENKDCPFHESPELLKRSKCNFMVVSVPWERKHEILKQICL